MFYIEKKESGREQIRQEDSDLVIDIYQLELEPFHVRGDKLQFFGDDHGAFLGFQTDLVLLPVETDIISAALKWYAQYLDYPYMDITLKDPRPKR